MELLITIFWILHLVATAAIILGWLGSLWRTSLGIAVMAWAARSQLLIGVILINLTFAQGPNYLKLMIKIVLAVVVVGLIEVAGARLKRDIKAPTLVAAAAGLTLLIAALSFWWA